MKKSKNEKYTSIKNKIVRKKNKKLTKSFEEN
jgi:hypothetical protein